jgi:predicted flap endonuclease-1-like 5' DNA nuclease
MNEDSAAKPPADAQATFDKAAETFPAKTPEEPCEDCGDDCKKCQEEMKKALEGKLYDKGIGNYSAQDLNDATVTTFGELSAGEAKGADAIAMQQNESEGVASMMFNRHNAVASGQRPKGSNFTPGKTPHTLSGVSTSKSQFHGNAGGKKMLKELTRGKLQGEPCRRQCQRWRASKKAVEKFAKDPAALDKFNKDNGTFYYNRAVRQPGGITRTLNTGRGEVRFGGTDFSGRPMGTDATANN